MCKINARNKSYSARPIAPIYVFSAKSVHFLFHFAKSDIKMLKKIGIKMHKFAELSISWSNGTKLMPKSCPACRKSDNKMHKFAKMSIYLSIWTKLMPKSCSACRITPIYVFLAKSVHSHFLSTDVA